ncbi:hypothetical protein CspeluHIS016_0110660 [Cutaneotrichosporon spelunceum]|uniref:Uncharacterized protein n=1 Tax=Cutaneotrichosporon spelunceum TaxID=1672016 RepID=A0AAD3TPL7_9TREE|nr:hypothetical protein CspeluHIS016_0110660 [Cutaneotrichosporon spelunceum]
MPPTPRLRKRKSAAEIQEREAKEAERQFARARAKSRASLENATEPMRDMVIKATSSRVVSPPPPRGTKRKEREERAVPARFSPPPIDTGASDDTLDSFAQAIGAGPLVGRLMWRGLEDAAALWSGVEEYILFARQRGDQAPFFPAKRVTKYIAYKALKEYKMSGIVVPRQLKHDMRAIEHFHSALGLKWDETQQQAANLVIGGALKSWGEAVEAHIDGERGDELGGML